MDLRGPRHRPPKAFSPLPLDRVSHEGCRRFVEYWRGRRRDGGVPHRADLDPLIDVPALAPGFFIYDVVEGGGDFRLRLMGTGLVRLFGRDVTGKLLSEFWAPGELAAVCEAFRACIREAEAVAGAGSFHWEGRDFVEWESVAAPVRIARAPHVQVFGYTSLDPALPPP
jgi:hypothetical protein